MVIFSCEEHNILDDLGNPLGSQLADVYLEPGAGSLEAGAENVREVRFWSTDDTFEYIGLWEHIDLNETFKVKVEGTVFEHSITAELTEWREYRQDNFTFSDWVPAERCYVRETNYLVDPDYDAILEDVSTLTFASFSSRLPEDFETLFYDFCLTRLSRNQLNTVSLEFNAFTQNQFDELYGENGLLTDSGEEALRNELMVIGLESLTKETHEIESEYEITVAYRVINGTGLSNESRRSFSVF